MRVRLFGHRAYGFHSAAPLIAAVHLGCGGIQLPPQLQMLRESRKWGLHDADAHPAGVFIEAVAGNPTCKANASGPCRALPSAGIGKFQQELIRVAC